MKLHRDFHLRPLVLLKLTICKLHLAGLFDLIEFCHRCGRRVRNVWWAHPELWNEVTGMGEGGVRCASCFDIECGERGVRVVWHPIVESRRDAQGRWSDVPPPAPELYPVAARLYAERRAAS